MPRCWASSEIIVSVVDRLAISLCTCIYKCNIRGLFNLVKIFNSVSLFNYM